MAEGRPECDQGGRPQRQDSLEDQMRDVMMLAVRMGCYDAHDWLVRNYRTAVRHRPPLWSVSHEHPGALHMNGSMTGRVEFTGDVKERCFTDIVINGEHLTLEQKQRGYVDLENGRTV